MILIKCCCSLFSNIFSVGKWRDIFTSYPNEDPRILALKNDIPEYCLKSKAEKSKMQKVQVRLECILTRSFSSFGINYRSVFDLFIQKL